MDYIKITPLGGLGEIGLNSLVIEYSGQAVLIDLGQMFSSEPCYGIDAFLPDLSYLMKNGPKLLGIVATHGHEDHIGALPYFFEELNTDVYGSDFTLAILREKLREKGIKTQRLSKVNVHDKLDIGPFNIEFLPVSHSIVGTMALAITTPVGKIIHTSDFKTQSPLFDQSRFSSLGKEGVLLLMSDSTNVECEGLTPSEANVIPPLEIIFKEAKNKIILTTFASHILRIGQIFKLAENFGRKVIVAGRSMLANVQIAIELGYLKIPPGLWVNENAIHKLDPNKLCLLATGSQGEYQSVLRGMASHSHKHLKVEQGDIVVFSSKVIPGNERAIYDTINSLYQRGAKVYYEKVSDVHVSGHGSKEDQKLMINLINPTFFMPIHGETRHLKQHIELAKTIGISDKNLIFIQNGNQVRLFSDHFEIGATIPTGRVLAGGKMLNDIDHNTIKDRRILSHEGIVVVLVAINQQTGTIESLFDLVSKGFLNGNGNGNEYLSKAKMAVEDVIRAMNPEARQDKTVVENLIKRTLRLFFNKSLHKRPVIMPVILQT